MFKDYYQILEISQESTIDEIKSAFKKQALRWHPDKNIGKDTTQIMQDINEAYLILKDIEARTKYNEEYRRFNEFKKSKQIIVVEEPIKSDGAYSKAEKEYVVHDEVLFRWMENARQQAIKLAKETLEDLLGMTKAGLKEAGKNALFSIISIPIIFIFLVLIVAVFSTSKCNSKDELPALDSLNNNNLTFHQQLDIFRNLLHRIPDTSFQINSKHILYFQREINNNLLEDNKFYLTNLKFSDENWTIDSRWIIESGIGLEVDSVQLIYLNNKTYFYYELFSSGGSLGGFALTFVIADIESKENYSLTHAEIPSIIRYVTITNSSNLIDEPFIEKFLKNRLSVSKRIIQQTQSEKIAQKFLNINASSIDTLLQTTMNSVYLNQVRTSSRIFNLQDISNISITMIENNDFMVFSIFKGCLWCFDKRSNEFICLWVPQSIYSWVDEIRFSEAGNLNFKDVQNNQFTIFLYQSIYVRNHSNQLFSTNPITPPEGWDRYLIPNKLEISIPQTMEIQSGEFEKMADSFYRAINMSSPNLVFQQKGLNNRELAAAEKYARIMLIVNEDISDKVIEVSSDINTISDTRLEQIDTELKTTLADAYRQNNVKLVKWNGVKLIKINNMSCLFYSHIRQLGNRPEIFVLNYSFEKNGARYILTLSYRIDKEYIYKRDFQTVIDSFVLL